MNDDAAGPRTTVLGKLVIFLFVGTCAAGAWWVLKGRGGDTPTVGGSQPGSGSTPVADGGNSGGNSGGAKVAFGLAYGTEKKRWMEWAVLEFAKTPAGQGIEVQLIPLGSLEGAQALLKGDQRIAAWSPASSLYKASFLQDWQVKYSTQPIAKEEMLALTPMVFVWWAERQSAFAAKYGATSFKTIGTALAEKTGWAGIAKKPEWGLFKFGHTNPNQSNSGLVTLVSMAYEYHGKSRGLALADILDNGFQQWLDGVEAGVTGMSNSTGTMMKEMVLKGPSAFDCLFVYESVAIDYLKNAEGRWGELRIEYPIHNLWNDNPYYVIDAPWVTPAQRKAAEAFLTYLLTEPVQRQALVHGLRPGNPEVGVRFADSPFETMQRYGLRNDLSAVAENPSPEVVANLLATWQRSRGNR